ncbi:hypothetical protein KI387_021702, partial [Taxus chinensis]
GTSYDAPCNNEPRENMERMNPNQMMDDEMGILEPGIEDMMHEIFTHQESNLKSLAST